MRPLNRLVAACALFFLGAFSGCVRFQPQPINANQSAVNFQARALNDPELGNFIKRNSTQKFSWPIALWDFQKLTLAAFYFHPDLDVARAKWVSVKAGKITAGERPNPTLSFSPAYNTSTPPPWILAGNLDIPIETAGKRGYRIAQANNLSEAARLNIASTAWNVRRRLRKNFVALYAATQRQALLKKQDAIQSANVHLLEEQLKLGAVSRFEVTQSRLALANGRLTLRDAETQLAQARVDLANSIGVTANALEKIQLSFAGFENVPAKISYRKIRRNALLDRADILSALAEYAAAESALHLEIVKQYPDIHLSPGYELDQTENKWGLGISATLPVFNHNKGAIAEAEAHRKELAAQFNALQSRVIGEIDRAFAGYRSVLKKTSVAENLLRGQDELEKSSEAMLNTGEISKQEFALTQIELNAAKLDRLDALIEAQNALGILEDAVQRPIGREEKVFELPTETEGTK